MVKLTFDAYLIINFCPFSLLVHHLQHLRMIVNDDEELFSAVVICCRFLGFALLNLMAIDGFSELQPMIKGCCPSRESYRY